jgi:hypothetical protein
MADVWIAPGVSLLDGNGDISPPPVPRVDDRHHRRNVPVAATLAASAMEQKLFLDER